MPIRWATTSGNWSNLAIWNDSASLGFPTASDDVWANNNNINIDQSFSVVSLNSTARARDIATPTMTANNAPSPFVAAASSVSTGAPFRAFDKNTTSNSSATWWESANSTPWLSIDLGNSTIIDGYTIYGSNNQLVNPRNWTLEGSNDNANWTVLHTVTSGTAIPASGTYSISSIGNSTGYRYYRVNISANGGGASAIIVELELYQRFTAAIAAGGSFIFNSGSISGSTTSTTAALSAGATNLIQVTATTGSVTLNLSSNISPVFDPIIAHSGGCNLNLNAPNFTGGGLGIACIRKSSAGTITITGNLVAGGAQNSNPFISTNGNTVVNGNLIGNATSTVVLSQTAGNVTIIGNVTAVGNVGVNLTGAASQFTVIGNVTGGTVSNAHGINHSGISGSVVGNISGGSATTAYGLTTVGNVTVTGTVTGGTGNTAIGLLTTGVVNVTGNLIGSTGDAIRTSSTSNIVGNITGGGVSPGLNNTAATTCTVSGNVTATSTACGITSTSTGIINLTGNMINVSGRQAIFAQNLFISNAATSQWRLFTQGGQDKTLYSADTFPNQPSPANVRSGSLFGPANALSGSMVVPVPSDVRVNVLTDNTVGTGQSLTAADFLAAISASADPYAQRLRNVATVDTVGSLITGLNGGGF